MRSVFRMFGLTLIEVRDKLNELIAEGHGDKEFRITYDSGYCGTGIPKKCKYEVTDTSVKFDDGS